jgi:hypothetical protein
MGAYTSTLFAEESRVWRAVRVAVTSCTQAFEGGVQQLVPRLRRSDLPLFKKWPAGDSVLSVFLVYGGISRWYLIVNFRNDGDAISKFAWSILSPVRYRHFAQFVGASNGLSTLLPDILRGQYNITFRVEGKERLREIVRHAFLQWEFIFVCCKFSSGESKKYILFFFSSIIFNRLSSYLHFLWVAKTSVDNWSRILNADLEKRKNLILIYYIQTFKAIIQTDSPHMYDVHMMILNSVSGFKPGNAPEKWRL